MPNDYFRFRQFTVRHDKCAMKVGTDGVLLGAWARGGRHILDIGTGTGLVGLMMAQRFQYADITCIDIDGEACAQAAENIAASPFASVMKVEHVALQQFASTEQRFDSIVSNPPFFIGGVKNPDVRRNMARHADTLSFRDLVSSVDSLLTENGVFSVIVPVESMDSLLSEAFIHGFFVTRKCLVRTKQSKPPRRCLLEFSRHNAPVEEEERCMSNADGAWSEWYSGLTGDFYLNV